MIDKIKKQKNNDLFKFFSLKKNIVGEDSNSKLSKISKYLRSNKSDYIFISAPENVAWIMNIRGKDVPNSPLPNCRLIISKTKKKFLISKKRKCTKLLKDKVINSNEIIDIKEFSEKILNFSGKNFIIDDKSCSIFFENIIKSKFKIKKRKDPTYLLKSIKNMTEINNMINTHILDGVALT